MKDKKGETYSEALTGASVSEGVVVNRSVERVEHIESNNNVHRTNNQSRSLVRTLSSRHLPFSFSSIPSSSLSLYV